MFKKIILVLCAVFLSALCFFGCSSNKKAATQTSGSAITPEASVSTSAGTSPAPTIPEKKIRMDEFLNQWNADILFSTQSSQPLLKKGGTTYYFCGHKLFVHDLKGSRPIMDDHGITLVFIDGNNGLWFHMSKEGTSNEDLYHYDLTANKVSLAVKAVNGEDFSTTAVYNNQWILYTRQSEDKAWLMACNTVSGKTGMVAPILSDSFWNCADPYIVYQDPESNTIMMKGYGTDNLKKVSTQDMSVVSGLYGMNDWEEGLLDLYKLGDKGYQKVGQFAAPGAWPQGGEGGSFYVQPGSVDFICDIYAYIFRYSFTDKTMSVVGNKTLPADGSIYDKGQYWFYALDANALYRLKGNEMTAYTGLPVALSDYNSILVSGNSVFLFTEDNELAYVYVPDENVLEEIEY